MYSTQKKGDSDMFSIQWRGNEYTNKSERNGHIPIMIVNHITAGTAGSCDNWFRTPNNKQSSAHFLVTKQGEIKQYVKIEEMAWANGLKLESIPKAKNKIVQEKKIKPNMNTVSIEHEGTTGKLTDRQLEASIWLHKHIQNYVQEKWDYTIPTNRSHIVGHCEIDPVRKAYCPGKDFPWKALMKGLRTNWFYEGIDFLYDKKLLNDIKGWKQKAEEPMPVWAVCLIMKRLYEQFQEKIS
jgi:N-acetyl-anhydromuramyl-L-alanine amidase AmpD